MYMDKSIILCNNKILTEKVRKILREHTCIIFLLMTSSFTLLLTFSVNSRDLEISFTTTSRLWQIVGHLFFLGHIFL